MLLRGQPYLPIAVKGGCCSQMLVIYLLRDFKKSARTVLMNCLYSSFCIRLKLIGFFFKELF